MSSRSRWPSMALAKTVHKFTECIQGPDLVCGAATQAFGLMTWSLATLTHYSSYQQLFDLMKLDSVTVKLVPTVNVADVNGTATPLGLANLYIAPNRDPNVDAPVSVFDVMNDDGVQILRLDRPFEFTVSKPKPFLTARNPATGLDVGVIPWVPSGDVWLNNTLGPGAGGSGLINSNAPYYGARWAIENAGSVGSVQVRAYYTFHFSCKEQD